jgi:hypothetical protein
MAQCLMSNLPSWIQALAAVGIVGLTLATLMVLKDYAGDTKTIASASASQIENSQMPFLAVRQKEQENVPNQAGGWVLENQGSGPAININYRFHHQGAEIVRHQPPISPGAQRSVHNDFTNATGDPAGFEIRYESLSGLEYRTYITWEAGVMQIRFQRPANR